MMWKIPGIGKTRRTYLDHAGAMPVLLEAREAFLETLKHEGNPGALHTEATEAMRAQNVARSSIAEELGCKAREVIFTSGGTEGNNLAILGLFRQLALSGKVTTDTHWIVCAIEHSSVLECFNHIKQMGGKVSVIEPDSTGRVQASAIAAALTKETVCISIGWANGEIGTVQPLGAISQAIRAYEKEHGTKIIFHSDAGQAPLYLFPQVHTLGVDILTLDGGKLGSPRGAGALFVKAGTVLAPLFYGGSQESGLRPGTENVALAAGMAAAMRVIGEKRATEAKRMEELREHLTLQMVQSATLTGAIINGSDKHHLPNIVNISIPGIDNEYITLALDQAGFALATKSACQEGERASQVILALTDEGGAWRASSALRISMGYRTTMDDIERFMRALERVIVKFRF